MRVELEIPSRSVYVGVVRLAVSSLAHAAGVDEETVDDLKMAVSEACANSVLANQELDPEAPVAVTWNDNGDRIVIEVGDRGRVFDPSRAPDPSADQRLWLSMALLRSLIEECEIRARPGGGMCTVLAVSH